MKTNNRHKWTFTTRFRARSFGWRASKLACQRIKEAVSEIKKVAKHDPVLGATGVIVLSEKLWPALEQIDSSSGALGTAVYNALEALLPILISAPTDRKTREKWLDRLWQAIEEDGVDYLSPITDRWGEVCGSVEVASFWADELVPIVRTTWEKPGSYIRGSTACLSCLLVSGRYQELFDLLELHPHKFWHYRQYGVDALLARDKKLEAIEYAENSRNQTNPESAIDRKCESILISLGQYEEAYQRYALGSGIRTTYLAHFREIAKRYSMKDKIEILKDLISVTPGEKGKWFATAKDVGCFDLAIELVSESYCDPKTLNRAARNYQEKNPQFALGAAIASLRWIAKGYGYEITGMDVLTAYNQALQAAERLGILEQVKHDIYQIVASDKSQFVQKTLGNRLFASQLQNPTINH